MNVPFEMTASVSDILGYVSSWSTFQRFKKAQGDEAAQKLLDDFGEKWVKLPSFGSNNENGQNYVSAIFSNKGVFPKIWGHPAHTA